MAPPSTYGSSTSNDPSRSSSTRVNLQNGFVENARVPVEKSKTGLMVRQSQRLNSQGTVVVVHNAVGQRQ